jgi:DNA-binding transcriptional regulator YdaS (Cro superfamily)
MSPGLTRAIETAGSMGKLARILGISQQAVSQWREVPTRHIIAIERATGVPREVLRPDLYRRRRRKLAAK